MFFEWKNHTNLPKVSTFLGLKDYVMECRLEISIALLDLAMTKDESPVNGWLLWVQFPIFIDFALILPDYQRCDLLI